MTVFVKFHMDTKQGDDVKTIQSPFADRDKAADKIDNLLEKVSNSSSPHLRVRDASTGRYVFIHTMKLASVVVTEVSEQE